MYRYSLGMYEKAAPDALPLEEKLRLAKEVGYDHLELCVDLNAQRAARLDWTPEEREHWRVTAARMGVPFTTLSLSLLRRTPLGLLDREKNEEAFDVLERGAALAVDLGSRVMLVNGYDVYDEPSTEATRARFFESLPRAVEICARHGVILAFENAEKPFCATVAQAAEIARRGNSPYCCIYADIANCANAWNGDAEKAAADLESGAGRIAALHLKDSIPGEYRFTGYGRGHVDFARSVEVIRRLGVRIFTAELFCEPDGDYAVKAAEVNRFLRGYLDV